MKKSIILTASILCFCTAAHAEKDLQINGVGSFSTTYDDNVAYSKNHKISDVINTILVGVGLKHEGKTHTLEAGVDIRENIFSNHSSLTNTAEDAMLKFKKDWTDRDSFTFSEKFTHAEDPQNFDDEFGDTTGRFEYYRNAVDMAYRHELTKQWAWQAIYGNKARYVTDDSADAIRHQAGVEIDYTHSAEWLFLLAYDFITKDFMPGPQAFINRVSAGARYFLTKASYADAKVSVSVIDSFTDKTFTKPGYYLAFTNEIDEKTKVIASFNRDYNADRYTVDIFNAWKLTTTLQRQLAKRIDGSLSAFYGEGRFISSGVKENQQGIATALNYELRKNMSAFASYTFSQKESSSDARDYKRNAVTLGIKITF